MTAVSLLRRIIAALLLSIGLAVLWSGSWPLFMGLFPLTMLLAWMYPSR